MGTVELASGFSNTVTDGSLLPAAAVAMLVGVIGFLSPCVLPLVPGYLSYVAGLAGGAGASSGDGEGAAEGGVGTAVRQRRMVAGALLFVLGFTVVFVATGALFGTLGSQITEHRVALERIFGVVTIAMGLVFIGKIPFLQREFKVHRLPRSGLLGAPLLGLTFGLAWTPCLTPTLTAVYGLATSEATAGRGAVLSVAYCLGLGIPFVLVALGLGWVTGALKAIRRHARLVSQLGGAVLIVMGILLLTGTWDHWMNWLRVEFASSGVGSGL
ncbi:cytochrome c biogenesis protein CcdA [soil metagenome]|jgi:cytochrome c-type biogenesis protein